MTGRQLTARQQRLRAEMVQEILNSARRQLAEGDEVSLREIGREVGVTVPAIYRYFPSLSALTHVLAREVVDHAMVDIGQAAAELWSDGVRPTPADELTAAWRVLRALALDHPQCLRLVLMHADTAADLLAAVDEYVEVWARGVSADVPDAALSAVTP